MGCNKRGQTGTEIASQRERATMPTSEEFLEGSGSLAYEDLNLDIDSADVSAGRDDVRDNFDFDSFLKKDEEGMGFDFANSAGGKKEGVGHAQAYPPQPQVDTANAPQPGQKRSHSDAFLGCPERAPISPRQRRRIELSEPSVKGSKRPAAESNNIDASTEGISGVEALLQRWFDASATDVLLRPSDG